MTSSPFLISSAYSAACNAAVPEFTETAYFDLVKALIDFSNSCTFFPPSLEAEVSKSS